jgi:hypothetical protein
MFYGNAVTKTDKQPNDVSVIAICLSKFYIKRRPRANEQSFVSVQRFYVTCEKSTS